MHFQLKRARAPRADSFRPLVESHQARVYSLAWRILGDTGAAEEVAQDVFLALHRNLDRIVSEDHLLAWLRRVTVQRATDALRRRAAQPEFGAEEFQEERFESWLLQAPSTLSRWSDREEIEAMVACLGSAQRTVLLLRYQEDMTPGEIAQTLAMPLATVKSHLRRALKTLREKRAVQDKESVHD